MKAAREELMSGLSLYSSCSASLKRSRWKISRELPSTFLRVMRKVGSGIGVSTVPATFGNAARRGHQFMAAKNQLISSKQHSQIDIEFKECQRKGNAWYPDGSADMN